jgi:hypothetical protein
MQEGTLESWENKKRNPAWAGLGGGTPKDLTEVRLTPKVRAEEASRASQAEVSDAQGGFGAAGTHRESPWEVASRGPPSELSFPQTLRTSVRDGELCKTSLALSLLI